MGWACHVCIYIVKPSRNLSPPLGGCSAGPWEAPEKCVTGGWLAGLAARRMGAGGGKETVHLGLGLSKSQPESCAVHRAFSVSVLFDPVKGTDGLGTHFYGGGY